MLNETTQPIPGFEGIYWVSHEGYVTNGRKKLKPYKINSGYLCLKLTGSTGVSSHLVHRLVAQVFLPNPLGKREVNHLDGIKENCAVGNLEWVTSSENKQHARATGLSVYNVPTLGINKGTTSKYHNVTWDKSRNKWVGSVRHNKKTWHQKRFNTEDEAALHVNWILDTLGLSDRPKNVVI